MSYNRNLSYGKISILISGSLFLIPILSFLNKINLPQILINDFYLIFISQTILFIIVLFISLFFYKIIFRNFIEFRSFFLLNSLTVYLLFFYKSFKSFLYLLHKKFFLIDDFIVVSFYILLYFLIIKFEKKIMNFLIRFLSIFIILQIGLFSYNFYNFKINYNSQKISQKTNKNNLKELDINLIKENKYKDTIFFIILDGMINLELAEELEIITNKKKIIEKLNDNKFSYKSNFYNNYDATYLSIASLLQGKYPVIETDKRYRNRDKFFPAFILNKREDNNFFKILRKTNRKFYWLGNPWAFCHNNTYINCINNETTYKLIPKIKSFYFDSIFFYFFNFYSNNKNEMTYINFLTNFDRKFNQNEIYLIHVLSPHPPYEFDKNCNILDKIIEDKPSSEEEMIYYTNAYNCLLDVINKFSNEVDKSSKNNMIFVFGDHGWSFDNKIMKQYNLEADESRFKPFFAYKVPSRCDQIKAPKSIVNIMRFALKCSGNSDIQYLRDIKFKTFYEASSENFGKVYEMN